MKDIYLGSFFGKTMKLEVEDNDNFDYVKAHENWVASMKGQAIEEYKDDLFFKKLDKRAEEMKKGFWYNFFKGNLR